MLASIEVLHAAGGVQGLELGKHIVKLEALRALSSARAQSGSKHWKEKKREAKTAPAQKASACHKEKFLN
eukprot:1145471-Pelagomonas_calceolata.AAC.3